MLSVLSKLGQSLKFPIKNSDNKNLGNLINELPSILLLQSGEIC